MKKLLQIALYAVETRKQMGKLVKMILQFSPKIIYDKKKGNFLDTSGRDKRCEG